jgi:lipopolysaccharide transport system permease protein
MTLTRLKVRYRQSLLGWLWAVLQPLALVVLYGAIFSHLATSRPTPYALFVFAGVVPWAFCATSISTAASGMLAHQHLIKQVYFPREIIPLSFVAASLFDLLFAMGVLLAAASYAGSTPSWALLGTLPILAILVLLVAAICLLISALQIGIRDISVALPLVLQVLMFTAPVVYPATIVPAWLQEFYWLNPLALLIEAFRSAVLDAATPRVGDLVYCAGLALVALTVSYLLFKRTETAFVDEA